MFNYLHKFIFGYPSKQTIRIALSYLNPSDTVKWRCGLLYVCDFSIKELMTHFKMTKQEIIAILLLLEGDIKCK